MSVSPRTTDIAFAPAEPRRTASQPRPSATSTAAYGRTGPRRDENRAFPIDHRHRRRRVGGQRPVDRRQAHRGGGEPVAAPQRDVHRPVDAARFAELPGAVERIDDPDALGVEPTRVLLAFLREHGVIGAMDGELVGEVLLRDRVARRPSRPTSTHRRRTSPRAVRAADGPLRSPNGWPARRLTRVATPWLRTSGQSASGRSVVAGRHRRRG